MANEGLRPFPAIPKDLREWTRWCQEQALVADDDSVATATLQDGAVTYVKIQDVTADRVLGRQTTDGTVQELTAAQAAAIIQTGIEALNLALTGNIGFHGEAATAQQSDPGSPTLQTISGSGDDANINANFTELRTTIDALRSILNTKGLSG